MAPLSPRGAAPPHRTTHLPRRTLPYVPAYGERVEKFKTRRSGVPLGAGPETRKTVLALYSKSCAFELRARGLVPAPRNDIASILHTLICTGSELRHRLGKLDGPA